MSGVSLLLNTMRAQALSAGNTRADARMGLVTSYDPNRYAVKVQLMPEGAETGWLPLASPWIGNGWGMFAAPTPGDMIEVHFQEGSPEAGYACLRFYNDHDRPLPCPSGEFWLVHASGSMLKFHNDGSVELTAATNLTAIAGGKARISCEDMELHARHSYSWDVDGYGQRITSTGGGNYEIKTWQQGATTSSVTLPIKPPEGP